MVSALRGVGRMSGQGPDVWIDDRYRGAHGIGRYAREVTSRLSLTWRSLELAGAPADPGDFIRRLPGEATRGLIYSPGYGVLIRAKRQILTIHDLIHLKVDWPGRAKYLAYYHGAVRSMIRRTGTVITVSETSRREIEEWVGDDDVTVVNAGIGSSSAFVPSGPVAASDTPYMLYVGNLRRHKNLDSVLRALALLDGVRLRVVIPRAESAELMSRCRALDIVDKIEVLHGLSDFALAEQYRGAHATVMPSTLEGFGLPPLESLLCGTPVIWCSRCEAVGETVGDRGIAVSNAQNAKEWAEAMMSMRDGKLAVPPLVGAAYDWDTVAVAVSRLITEQHPTSGRRKGEKG